MNNPKYVLCPGPVTSKTDGQRHYISHQQLAMLYGVSLYDCLIYDPRPSWPEYLHRMAEERHLGLIKLRPRYDGDYTLPTE